MPLNRPIALPLALAAGLAALLAASGCDAARTAPADRGLKTGHFDLSPEARRLLPRGAVLYYGKHDRSHPGTRWAIEELDIDTGNTREVISTDTSGLINLQPHSLSANNRYLLFSAWKNLPDGPQTFLAELDLVSRKWRKIMDHAVRGFYSRDSTTIALYTSRKITPDTTVHRVYITDRTGKVLSEIPCESSSCRHPYWRPSGNSIVYADGKSTIYSYSVTQRKRSKILTMENIGNQRIFYPMYCQGRLIYFVDEMNARYSRTLGRYASRSNMYFIPHGSTTPYMLGDATDIVGLTCPPSYQLLLASKDARNQGFYVVLLDLHMKHPIRIVPPQASRSSYMNPVLAIRR